MTATQQDQLQESATRLVEECVGENLDQLATLDMRGDGILRVLYSAARGLHRAPLTLSAARALLDRVKAGERVLILTGFLAPKPFPETDGLIGSAVLAAALERAAGAVPVFTCEPDVVGPLRAAIHAAGLNVADSLAAVPGVPHPAVLLAYASTDEVDALARQIAPSACVAVERPGANAKGEYHLALGKNVTSDIAPIDELYRAAGANGALTIGIGDFGNELGMGAIVDIIRAETPAGADCGCGCGGGTACPTPADVTVVASVSDWGAYAIAACLAFLCRDASVLVSSSTYERICIETVRGGAIDGPTRYAAPYIDGIDQSFNAALLDVMRGAIEYPSRAPTDSPIRLFRAARWTASR